ncbi:MAG: uroporphyrinogen decarboxylase [Thermoplasmata archaeon]
MQDRFLRACWRKSVDRTPVWYMRQAGRYLPEYQKVRGSHGVLDIAKAPKLAVEIAKLPVDKLGVDAAILFADIMLPLEPMGLKFELKKNVGPVIHRPIAEEKDVDRLQSLDPDVHLSFLAETIGRLRDALDVPVIGFSGAPFTLASYLIEGRPSRTFTKTKTLMYGREKIWERLQEVLADMVATYLRFQIRAGVHAIQLFDSWVGALDPRAYGSYVEPYVREVFRATKGLDVPRLHFGTNTATLLERMRDAGGEVIGVDWRIPLDEAWRRLGDGVAIQGNLDPAALLAGEEHAIARTHEVLDQAGGHPGHIFNLGHGVSPGTSPDVLAAVTRAVHTYRGGSA